MGITSGLVLYAVIWFMTLFVVLPLRLKTQGDVGKIVPGTMAGSPEVHHLKRKFLIVTVVAAVLWAVIAGIILSGVISVCDFDLFGRGDCPGSDGTGA
jgi:predicted secreted protein